MGDGGNGGFTSASDFAQVVSVAVKEGKHIQSGLRALIDHPVIIEDVWTGLDQNAINYEAMKLHDSVKTLMKHASSNNDQIRSLGAQLGKRPPSAQMTDWAKRISLWLRAVAVCAHHAPNGVLREYGDSLTKLTEQLSDDADVNGAVSRLLAGFDL